MSLELTDTHSVQFSSVQSLSHVWLFATPWITACQASLSITNFRSSPKLMCIESVMPSSHLILCCPLLLLPPIPPSIRVLLYTKEINNKDVLHSAGNYIQEIEKEYMYVYVCTFVVVQSLSHVRFFETPWSAACQTSRLPCPSLSPRVCSNSCPLSWRCHPTSSSVVPFFCLRSFRALGSFPMSRLFASGSQSIGVSASASVLPKNIQGWFSKELTILVYSGCYNKNTMDWVACKQQKFVSPSPGGWKVQYQGPHRVCVWWGSTSLFKYSCVFTVSLYGRRDE